MTVVIDTPEMVFVEILDSANVIGVLSPDAAMIEIITATAPVRVETVPASQYLELVENALRGPTGPEGPPGGTMVSGWWSYALATTPPPATGQVRTAPAIPVLGQPYTIHLSGTDRDGLDWSSGSPGMAPGDQIRLRGTAGAVQHCTVTGYTVVPGTPPYATIETTLTAMTGMIAKNADVRVDLIRATSSGGSWSPSQQELSDAIAPLLVPWDFINIWQIDGGPYIAFNVMLGNYYDNSETERVITYPTGSEPPLTGLPDGTLLVEYTP